MTEVGIIPLMSDEHKNNITQTIKQHGRRLFNFIQSKVANTEDAKDILQDVFYQLAGNTKPVEQLSSWLFTVARNKITDNYRKKKPELLEDIFIGDEEDDNAVVNMLISSGNENFVSDSSDVTTINNAKIFLDNLMPAVAAFDLQQQISAQQEALKKAERKYKNLQDDADDFQKKKKKIEQQIEDNQKDQKDQQAEIEKQRQLLEALKGRQK